MSNLDVRPPLTECGGRADVAAEPVRELLQGRSVQLGESGEVRRLLPTLGRRMVGAWCFVDHYGPDDIVDQPGMQVPPHPHIGLQTVSWLLDGEVLHRDSLGSLQTLRPGTLGVMTAGNGIAHSEESPAAHSATLHGAQLWVALPDGARATEPRWDFHADLPVLEDGALRATVFMGEMSGARSAGTAFSPLVGVDLTLAAGGDARLPLEPDFEYAVLTTLGVANVDGVDLAPGSLLYLGCGRSELQVSAATASHMLLLGGEPFAEEIVMWWNFVARTGEEIDAARTDWMNADTLKAGSRFGEVRGYAGDRLPAPALPTTRLKPRGRVR
ncbi:pirin family protein [Actinomadura rudentiformis]|uniref:Pirin family protein n=1 Tax=Actinomadura rudentiformis TaxID=359158 RepID=A0A6H9YJE2_9ACTN|nr:pirin family protein [Actinomadura rudentiformis]KAB2344397.1 pirin family protein [Actinomadura rudentiformis]